MATTQQLLKHTTRGAIVRMVNDENNTVFDGSEAGPLVISPPLIVGGTRTEVELSIRRQVSNDDILPFQGQLAFRYNRLDVEGTLQGSLDGYRPSMPTSTQVLLDELTQRLGIKFEKDDFVLEDVGRSNAAPYRLKAKDESYRWVGSTEFTLLDLTDLETFISGGLSGGPAQLQFSLPPTSTRNNSPYLNATVHRKDLDDILLNDPIDDNNHPLFIFLSKTLGVLGEFLRDASSPWVVSSTPTPYNLKGARLIAKNEIVQNLNAFVPAANLVARIRLSSLDTVFDDKDLLIPYAIPNFSGSEFNNAPRFKVSAVVNASNGTPWNRFLNTLVAPSIITSLPVDLNLRFSGPDEWVADINNPSPTNLYNAVVQYNGSKRAYDVRGLYTECNRILAVTVSAHNIAYEGNLIFHYRAPIVINEVMPQAIFGDNYNHEFAPSEGIPPYDFTLVSGGLAPNHTLTTDFRVTGLSTTLGNYFVTYDVQDAIGTVVRYALNYRVVIGPIVVSGTPNPAIRGQPYEHTFLVTGGVAGYTYRLLDNNNSELLLPSPFSPRIVGNFTGDAGPRYYNLEITDDEGTVFTTDFLIDVS
jgi:hypothetical protein